VPLKFVEGVATQMNSAKKVAEAGFLIVEAVVFATAVYAADDEKSTRANRGTF
jgi:hypothetical protein